MTFNSFSFYLFFITVVVVNYVLPRRWRWVWLLLSSYVFYGLSDIRFLLILVLCTSITYTAGRMIEKSADERAKKRWLSVGLVSIVGILILFKYLNFLLEIFNIFLASLETGWAFRGIDLLFPIGISFYSFQVISYMLDVHSGKITAEKHFLQYASFVAFFPQLLIGPIERYGQLKPQLTNPEPFDWQRFVDSLVRIGWGLFKKFVIADRLAIVANTVFAMPDRFSSPKLAIGVLAFSFQIYLDFSAYCDIAIGSARILGVNLTENFNRPYFAQSVIDFWRRWHISLSNWLRDYVFLKLNFKHRRRKPRSLWTGLDVMTTFLVSGLWHGANWTFVVWGLLHGAYQTIELLTLKGREKLAKRLRINRKSAINKTAQTLFTFLLVSFAWIFFKAESINQAFMIIRSIFTLEGTSAADAWIFTDSSVGLDRLDLATMLITLIVYLVVEFAQQKHNLLVVINSRPLWQRWIIYYVLFFAITIFGFYGETTVVDFVYFQF